ncbi:hypothetical protein DPMN_024221 [Dreissena polymorpha]|uniref:Glycoside hydrolase family 38 N-terminal domain-containing protein n=1 Tax=Dreissena polymorpha TaxID=45954 RepID=A0A9D4LNH8_DREPO|nr:hypothetical protein DPMN_024221 [Dreissena polymorpha]
MYAILSRAHCFQFGFDGMFVGRIDYQDKQKREATKTLEMVWKTSDSLGATDFTYELCSVKTWL